MDSEDINQIGVGVSGGTDSAAVCLQLLEAGRHVTAFTMILEDNGGVTAEKGAAVAARLGIPHVLLDLRRDFEQVILKPFVEAYATGRTPSPCIVCNAKFKFGAMWQAMAAHGCSQMATGHYAQIRTEQSAGNQRFGLYRGADPRKDQSYFLAQLSQEQLSHAIFPLGGQMKTDIRQRVIAMGLVDKAEHESQDLCFLPDGNFAAYVAARRPELLKDGPVVTLTGQVLGRHHGAFQFTAGQRRGLGLGGGPWFVVKTNVQENVVVVAHDEDMNCRELSLCNMNWLVDEPAPGTPYETHVQVRYLMKPKEAVIIPRGNGQAQLIFRERVTAAPPGQLAVAYDGDRVVASGWIEE